MSSGIKLSSYILGDVFFSNRKALATKAHFFSGKTQTNHCYICYNISPETVSNRSLTAQADHKTSSAALTHNER